MAQVLLVVHGMGNLAGAPQAADRNAWAKQIEQILRSAAAAYPNIDAKQLIVEPVLYDDVFQRYALGWEKLAQALEGTPLASVTSFMRDAGDGGFLWGSLGDVVQYRALALVREHVLAAVAAQFAAIFSKHGSAHSYSVLAHSLGTAVAHDAITVLATRAVAGNTVMQPPNFRFANLFALANVSKLVWATTEDFYANTCVRPLASGMTWDRCAVEHYMTFRHVADPIASVVRFAPAGWAPARFEKIDLRHFRDVNVHAFEHYLRAPQVVDRILTRLFPASITRVQRAARFAAFSDYVDPEREAKQVAVAGVEQTVDALAGQTTGQFELDIRALAKALWDSRQLLIDRFS